MQSNKTHVSTYCRGFIQCFKQFCKLKRCSYPLSFIIYIFCDAHKKAFFHPWRTSCFWAYLHIRLHASFMHLLHISTIYRLRTNNLVTSMLATIQQNHTICLCIFNHKSRLLLEKVFLPLTQTVQCNSTSAFCTYVGNYYI